MEDRDQLVKAQDQLENKNEGRRCDDSGVVVMVESSFGRKKFEVRRPASTCAKKNNRKSHE